jgi:ABC-type multidrug transport system permease subunit
MNSDLDQARPNSRATKHLPWKTFAAIIAGFVTWVLVASILNFPLRAWWPHYHEAETVFSFTLGMKLARLALGAAASLCSGFVAAWIANGQAAAVSLGILLLALFIPNHYLLWNKFPVWYHLTFLVSLFPLTVLGAILKLSCRRRALN